MIRTTFVLLALTMTLGGCSSGGTRAAGTTTRRNPNVITQAELAEPSVNTLTLYDAIQRLRPNWLRARGAASINNVNTLPGVMINESFSSVDMLRGMRATDVTQMEFMSGADATTLYGTGYVNGLIKVKTGSGL